MQILLISTRRRPRDAHLDREAGHGDQVAEALDADAIGVLAFGRAGLGGSVDRTSQPDDARAARAYPAPTPLEVDATGAMATSGQQQALGSSAVSAASA